MKTRNLVVLNLLLLLILLIFAALHLLLRPKKNNENTLDIKNSVIDKHVQYEKVRDASLWLNSNEGAAYSNYGQSTCSENPRRKQLTILFERWKDIARKLNITYVLTGGSLLGAWRNGDIIPFDHDIDIQIDENDVPKLISIAHKRNHDTFYKGLGTSRLVVQEDWAIEDCMQWREFDCNGELVTEEKEHQTDKMDKCVFPAVTARLFDLNPSFKEVKLDIFHYKSHNGFIQCSCWNAKWSHGEMFPRKLCRFLGSSAWCPNNSGVVLRELYPRALLHPTKKCVDGKWVEVQDASLIKTLSKKCDEFVRTEVKH